MRGWLILLLATAGACGPGHAGSVGARSRGTAAADRGDEPRGGAGEEAQEEGAFDRSLAQAATWTDLVTLARRLDERRADTSEDGCLLGSTASGGHRLAANLAVTVRPLATPARGVLDVIGAEAELVVVSRWGVVATASRGSTPRLVADFTLTPPPPDDARHAIVAVARGVLALRPLAAAPTATRELDPSGLPAALSAAGLTRVHVVAEPDVPLARIAALLEVLDETGTEVALAVLLPEGARPPDPASAGGDGPPLCPDGLPEPGGDGSPPDARELLAIRQALGPLRDAASRCHGEAMMGGVASVDVVLAFRIDADGTVPEACVVEESRSAPTLRRCLSAAARAVVFPSSATRGPIVLEVPLSLRARAAPGQRPRCADR